MFDTICNNYTDYKAIVKVDLDTYFDKNYVLSVLKFLSENSEKRIYFGNPRLYSNKLYFEGRFYAMTQKLVEDYCKCKPSVPKINPEDVWLSHTIADCLSKDPSVNIENIHHMLNDETKIYHKEYKIKGLHLKLGRNIK
ncbi:hypothetical protein AYI69_g10968 [Smittium culicis]|uniref:Hexosyltransferase n=1 Tax=Smittium culicis TaxID=133412 RepID=A0A1R1X274_9FUNG|nr:hypothetical protein AYI69_g10968 [Smittium culicis]